MAIAIASGVTPDRGLYTAIIGGFLISALGGSRFQIGGPAGAFIVLVAATVAQHGIDGLILATFLSGIILLAVGLLRLGTFIKYIPYPVTVGFTAGHRRHHPRQPDQGTARPDARRRGAGPVRPQARRPWRRRCRPSTCPRQRWRALSIAVILAVRRVPSALAGLPDRRGAGFARRLAAGICRSRPSARASAASPAPCRCRSCPPSRREDHRGAAGRAVLRAAGRHREPALGRGRRQHDRAAAPLQLRAGGAGRRQHRPRRCSAASASPAPSRAPRPMCAPARAGRSPACCMRCSCCCSCWWRRRSPATSRSPRSPPCSRSSPGTWRRSTPSRPCCGPRAATRSCCSRPSCWWCSAT